MWNEFVIEVTKAVSLVEIKAVDRSGHSFRIGIATMTAKRVCRI